MPWAESLEMSVPMFGAFCLGLALGWLTRFFLERFVEFSPKSFSALASVLCGGVVLGMFKYAIPTTSSEEKLLTTAVFCYPIGLFFGLIAVYPIVLKFDSSVKQWIESDKQWAEIFARRREQRAQARDLKLGTSKKADGT